MKKVLVMSLLALVVMTMSSCLRVKIDGKDWNFGGHTNAVGLTLKEENILQKQMRQ